MPAVLLCLSPTSLTRFLSGLSGWGLNLLWFFIHMFCTVDEGRLLERFLIVRLSLPVVIIGMCSSFVASDGATPRMLARFYSHCMLNDNGWVEQLSR